MRDNEFVKKNICTKNRIASDRQSSGFRGVCLVKVPSV